MEILIGIVFYFNIYALFYIKKNFIAIYFNYKDHKDVKYIYTIKNISLILKCIEMREKMKFHISDFLKDILINKLRSYAL